MEKRTINDQLNLPVTAGLDSNWSNLEGTALINCISARCGNEPHLSDAKYTIEVRSGGMTRTDQDPILYNQDKVRYSQCAAPWLIVCGALKTPTGQMSTASRPSTDPRTTDPNAPKVLIDHFANNGGDSTGATTGATTGVKIGIGVGAIVLVGFGIWFFGFKKKG